MSRGLGWHVEPGRAGRAGVSRRPGAVRRPVPHDRILESYDGITATFFQDRTRGGGVPPRPTPAISMAHLFVQSTFLKGDRRARRALHLVAIPRTGRYVACH